MAQKIILFVSPLSAPAKAQLMENSNAPGDSYKCPNGEPVYGLQTNEAPVKFLLRKYPDVSEILCLVTPVCRKVPDGGGQSAWERLKKTIEDTGAKAKLEPFDFTEDNPPQESVREMISNILRRIDSKDEILLETTGGFRNAIMYLLLISRALSYKGVETTYAVYSNLQTKEIEDITPMLQIFDLIDGMQNLTSFGNVRKLQEYYKDCKDDKINTLLTEANRLWECITLCRSNLVPERLQSFNTALMDAETCDDALLKALLPAFQDKFGKRTTIPTLILWCVNSDMIQQALTLYRECIPVYVMDERHNFLTVKANSDAATCSKGQYKSIEEARFCEYFLKIGFKIGKTYVETLMDFEAVLKQSDFNAKCPVNQLRNIFMDYLYIKNLRNMANHASEKPLGNKRPLIDYLKGEGYKDMDDPNDPIMVEDVKAVIRTALEHLELQPQTP